MLSKIGDGYCDDETNNIPCSFDGGDCCYSCINKARCSQCKCLGNEVRDIDHPLIEDGYCHDEINNANCSYDGGDCCVNVNKTFCSDCTCNLEDTCAMNLLPSTGDGICNDETNNIECNFDHGDCCLTNMNVKHCLECSCSSNGIVTSPGFPEIYEINLDIAWLIQLPLGQLIQIYFIRFELGYQSSGSSHCR